MIRHAVLSLAVLASLSGPVPAETAYLSTVPGLEIAALDSLPDAPADQQDRDLCAHLTLADPTSPAARAIAAKGWSVTSETPFANLTAVGFVGGFTPGTSGTCELTDGNIALYAGDQIVAVIYAASGADIRIGHARAFGQDGLRIFSGDTLPAPLADVIGAGAQTLTVIPPAASETVCNGAASVPFVYNLPIDQARALLMQSGWQPIPVSREDAGFSQAADIAKAGVPEVEDCSGTGFAFCLYGYTGPAGDLGVVTAGEIGEAGQLPWVSSYSVTCR